MSDDYTPDVVRDLRDSVSPTENVRRMVDQADVHAPSPTKEQFVAGLIVVLALADLPVAAFVVAMSQAKNHNDTVMPIVTLGMGTMMGGKRVKGYGPRSKQRACMTCGGDNGNYVNPHGYRMEPTVPGTPGDPERICADCFFKATGTRPTGKDAL